MFTTYLNLLDKEADDQSCQKAVHFALEKRHEAYGHEKLACRLLAKAVTHGIGFEETLEFLLRLEDRAEIYRSSSSSDGCYDCNDDPELSENIDLLKKALLEVSSPLRAASRPVCFRQ